MFRTTSWPPEAVSVPAPLAPVLVMSPNKPLSYDEHLIRWDALHKVRAQVACVRDAESAVASHGKWNGSSTYSRTELCMRMRNEIELGFQYKSLRALLEYTFVNKRSASSMSMIETITSWRACSRLRWRTMRDSLAAHIKEDAIKKFYVAWWWKMRTGLVAKASASKKVSGTVTPDVQPLKPQARAIKA